MALSTRSPLRPRILLRALETRLMFDAAGAPDASPPPPTLLDVSVTLDAPPSPAVADTYSALPHEAEQASAEGATPDANHMDSTGSVGLATGDLFVMVAPGAPGDLTSGQQQSLSLAIVEATQAITTYLSDPAAIQNLEVLFPGDGSASVDGHQQRIADVVGLFETGQLSFAVELRSNEELNGFRGAFSAGLDGTPPSIYLNADWISSLTGTEQLVRVLVEEFGHDVRRDQPLERGLGLRSVVHQLAVDVQVHGLRTEAQNHVVVKV